MLTHMIEYNMTEFLIKLFLHIIYVFCWQRPKILKVRKIWHISNRFKAQQHFDLIKNAILLKYNIIWPILKSVCAAPPCLLTRWGRFTLFYCVWKLTSMTTMNLLTGFSLQLCPIRWSRNVELGHKAVVDNHLGSKLVLIPKHRVPRNNSHGMEILPLISTLSMSWFRM